MKRLVVLLFLISKVVYSQKYSVSEAISNIESLYNHELYIGQKVYEKINISRSHSNILIEKESKVKEKRITKYKFNLNNVDKKNIVIKLIPSEKGLGVLFIAKTFENDVIKTEVSYTGKIPLSSTDNIDEIVIGCTNNFTKNNFEIYINSLITLFDVKSKDVKLYMYDYERDKEVLINLEQE